MAGWITELLGSLSGDVAEVVQGTPALAARHQEIVAKRVAREIETEAAARAAGAPWLLRPLAGALARHWLMGAEEERRRAGAGGEDAVCAALRPALGRRWTIVRGAVLQLGGRWRELDLILVGPAGVLAVEVTCWPREVSLPGDGRAVVRRRGRWDERPCPVRQAQAQRALLGSWLRQHGLVVPAGSALLFPNTLAVTGETLAAPDAPFVCWGPEAAAALGRALRDAPREHLREAELRALVALLTR